MKRICQNPHHPFKQKWYNYEPGEHYLWNPDYCTSCSSYLHLLKSLLEILVIPRETLYGNKMIETDPEQLYEIIKEIWQLNN